MSTSVSGIGLGKGSPNAGALARAIAVTIALFIAFLAATPARADDTAGIVLSQTSVDSQIGTYGANTDGDANTPPPNSLDTIATADNSQSTSTAQQSNTASNTQTTTTVGGNGGTATGGNAGPSHVTGNGSQAGAHGGDAYANGGNAESHSTLESQQSNQISVRDSSGSAYSGNGNNLGSDDSFVLEPPKTGASGRAAAQISGGAAAQMNEARLPALFGLGTAGRTTWLAVKEARGPETAKASPLGAGLPGHGGQLPGQNSFFNLLSGPGGAGAGLMLLLLAVLGAAIALPNDLSNALRTRAGPWRPLAYVPPIELPG